MAEELTSLDASPSPPGRTAAPPGPWRTAAERTLLTGVVPLGATCAFLRFLVPTPMEGGDRGLTGLLARLGDEHPLFLGVALFLVFAATARYWYGHWRPPPAGARMAPARDGWRRPAVFALGLVAVVLVAAWLHGTVFAIYRVVSPSMVPTLNVGDRVVVNRLAYGVRLPFTNRVLRARPPRRGDIVVFSSDAAGTDVTPTTPRWLVKRIIGLPGDVVSFQNGYPIVNGWVVPSCDAGPFASTAGATTVRGRLNVELMEDRAYLTVRMPLDGVVLDGFRVRPDEVFVIGDDRGQSSDSRTWNRGRGGSVPLRSVAGRVSHLAIGGYRDGTLDWRRLLAPLSMHLHEPRVDVNSAENHIRECLSAQRPPSLSPPPAPAPGTGLP